MQGRIQVKGGHKYKIYFPSDWLPTAPWAAPVLEVGKLGSFPGPCLLWTTIDGDIHPCMVVISGNGIVVLSRNNMAVICGVFKGILLGHYMAV